MRHNRIDERRSDGGDDAGHPRTRRFGRGVSVAGIKFEPGTAERDPETGAPIEAFQDIRDLGLDFNNAHVQPNGEYHFHNGEITTAGVTGPPDGGRPPGAGGPPGRPQDDLVGQLSSS